MYQCVKRLFIVQKQIIMKPNFKILLVEDNPLNQRLMDFTLKRHQHEVIIANNGLEALEKFKVDKFDIILMDVMMPLMDGFQATVEIRATEEKNGITQRTPIIAITANTMNKEKEKCSLYGMDGFLKKPFIIEEFNSLIEKLAYQNLGKVV